MDLTNMIPGGAGEEKTPQQQLSKEEYAAMKKQRVMSRVHYLEGDYEQLVINETIDGLFSSYRIDRNSLPKGFFLYEIRWDDSLSSLAEISPSVVVNHAGSFITKSPLEFDANNSIRITYTNFIEFCQFGEWAYEKLAVLDCNSGNVAVISPDRRLQTTEEIEIFLSGHCGYHLSEINWMVMKGDVLFLNENDF